MREIVLDTETTGMDPVDGHRLIEIGCVEIDNQIPTGRTYHQYINPERDVPEEAVAVHGLTQSFLSDKPVFSQIYSDFIEFIGDAKLVIHNASFDMKFINAELKVVGHPSIPMTQAVDTLAMARRKFPGSPANLDALCRRFDIDNTSRDLHGGLLDSELLAEVYLELMGGRQHGLTLGESKAGLQPNNSADNLVSAQAGKERTAREKRDHQPSSDELAAHEKMLEELTGPIWQERG